MTKYRWPIFLLSLLSGVALNGFNDWTWVNPHLTGESLNSIAGNGQSTVVVGNHGTILVSQNLMTWQTRSAGSTADWHGVSWHEGRFIVVGEGGRVALSEDGIAWLPAAVPTSDTLRKVVAYGGRAYTYTREGSVFSSVDGNAWLDISPPPSMAITIHDLWSTPEGIYIRVQIGSDEFLWRNLGGNIWHSVYGLGDEDLFGFGGGYFFRMRQESVLGPPFFRVSFARSKNGQSWEDVSTGLEPGPGRSWRAVLDAGEDAFILRHTMPQRTYSLFRSSDGFQSAENVGSPVNASAMLSVLDLGHQTHLFTSSGGGLYLRDAIDWEDLNEGFSGSGFRSSAASTSMASIATVASGPPSFRIDVYITEDFSNWDRSSVTGVDSVQASLHLEDGFVFLLRGMAGGLYQDRAVFIGLNGQSRDLRFPEASGIHRWFLGAALLDGEIFVYAESNDGAGTGHAFRDRAIYASTDLENWRTIEVAGRIHEMGSAGGFIFARFDDGIRRSTDAGSWSTILPGNDIKRMVVADTGVLAIRENAIEFFDIERNRSSLWVLPLASGAIREAGYFPAWGLYYLLSDDDRIFFSGESGDWRETSVPTGNEIWSLMHYQGLLYAVGSQGTVMASGIFVSDLVASHGQFADRIRLNWGLPMGYSGGLRIWRGQSSRFEEAREVETVFDVERFEDFRVVPGESYFYWVETVFSDERDGSGLSGGLAGPVSGFARLPELSVEEEATGLIAWGRNDGNQVQVPESLRGAALRGVNAGYNHSIAVLESGEAVAWGRRGLWGETEVPPDLPPVASAIAGYDFNLVLFEDGTVGQWGNDGFGAWGVPAGLSNIVAIDAQGYQRIALRGDGRVVAWGPVSEAERAIIDSLSDVVKIAAGGMHALVLHGDGRISGWGANDFGQLNIPLGSFVDVAAGWQHSLAVTEDGRVLGWGRDADGALRVPPHLETGQGWGHARAGLTPLAGPSNVPSIAAAFFNSVIKDQMANDLIVLGDNRFNQKQTPAEAAANTDQGLSVGDGFIVAKVERSADRSIVRERLGTMLDHAGQWWESGWFGEYHAARGGWFLDRRGSWNWSGHGHQGLYFYDADGRWWWTRQDIFPLVYVFGAGGGWREL